MARSALESCPRPPRAVPARLAQLVLAVTLAACGGGGGSSGTPDTGAPLASGPPAPSAAPTPAPSAAPTPAPGASPPAPTPTPPAVAPAMMFSVRLLDPVGQAGSQGLNKLGQAAWTTADVNGQFARFFDGSQVQQVMGNRPARAVAVNDAGQVTGHLLGDSSTLVYRWSADAPDALVVIDLEPGFFGIANAINSQGQVTGMITRRNVPSAYRWTPPSPVTGVEGLDPISGAGTLPAVANGQFINDNGTVAGASSTADARVHVALWVPGQPVRDIGSLGGPDVSVDGLNDANQVVGQSDLNTGAHHAYRWSPAEGMVDLGTLGGLNSSATAINAGGTVVGTSDTADPGSTRAFVWNGAAMTSLGTLGGGWSAATAINASGQVAGTSPDANGMAHAFLWTATGGMVDLNTHLATSPGAELQSVVALADDGSMLVSSSAGLLLLRPQAP